MQPQVLTNLENGAHDLRNNVTEGQVFLGLQAQKPYVQKCEMEKTESAKSVFEHSHISTTLFVNLAGFWVLGIHEVFWLNIGVVAPLNLH